MNGSEKVDYTLEIPLSRERKAYVYLYGGAPTTEELQMLKVAIDNMDIALNGDVAVRQLPTSLPPAIVVTGDRPRHKEENKLQVKEVKTLLPPCLKHPEKGPVERSRFTNRCPLCDGIRLARTRTRQRYGGPGLTDEQKSDILQRYPAETLEQLRIKHKVPVEHVRGVLRAAGKLNTRERCTPLTEEEKSTLPDLYPSQMTLQQLWESFAGHSRECVRSALREKGLAAPGRPSRAITHEIRNRRLRSM